MDTQHRISGDRIALAVTQAHYLAAVAERAVAQGDPTSAESVEYAFAITPVPAGIDATEAATPAEVAAVQAIVRAAVAVVEA